MDIGGDFDLINAIRSRSWAQANSIVEERPHLVYVGCFPRCDYIDVDDDVFDNEEERSHVSARLDRRSALHGLCRIFEDAHRASSEPLISNNQERRQILNLVRAIIRTSHQSLNRGAWDQRHGNSFDKSLLLLYEGDQTPLHILCSRSCDLEMITIILESVVTETDGATIELPSVVDLLTSQNRLGCTPLHYIAENQSCSTIALSNILSLAERATQQHSSTLRDAMLITDDDQENPIHWAMSSQVSPDNFRLLLRYGGLEPLWKLNTFDDLPLHLFSRACEEDLSVSDDMDTTEAGSLELMKQYLAVIEDEVTGACCSRFVGQSSQDFLLHRLASCAYFLCPVYLFRLAARNNSRDLKRWDDSPEGLTPLQLCLSARRNETWKTLVPADSEAIRQEHENLICSMLQLSNEIAHLPSRKGRLSLHFAAESCLNMLVIDELIKLFPSALSTPDPETDLYPPLLAAVEDNNTLDNVNRLLLAYPSSVQQSQKQ